MITIYGPSQCGFCTEAVNLARKYQLKYQYKNIDFSKNYRELRSKNVDMKKAPHIWWGDKYVGHFGEFYAEIQKHLIMEELNIATS